MRALRPVPPPRLGNARQNTLENFRLGAVELAVRVESRLDHRAERRRPHRMHGIAPTPSTGTLHAPEQLPAPTWAPPLVRPQLVTTYLSNDRLRSLERGQLGRGVTAPVPPT